MYTPHQMVVDEILSCSWISTWVSFIKIRKPGNFIHSEVYAKMKTVLSLGFECICTAKDQLCVWSDALLVVGPILLCRSLKTVSFETHVLHWLVLHLTSDGLHVTLGKSLF